MTRVVAARFRPRICQISGEMSKRRARKVSTRMRIAVEWTGKGVNVVEAVVELDIFETLEVRIASLCIARLWSNVVFFQIRVRCWLDGVLYF